eukprot:g38715.t1
MKSCRCHQFRIFQVEWCPNIRPQAPLEQIMWISFRKFIRSKSKVGVCVLDSFLPLSYRRLTGRLLRFPYSTCMPFHFSPEEEPSPQLFTDVQNLKVFGPAQLEGFVKVTLSFLSHDPNAEADLKNFATEHKVKEKALGNMVRGILFFFSACLKKNLAASAVEEDLGKLGLDKGRAAQLSSTWQKQFAVMATAQIQKTLKVSEVVDIEWKFGVTAASNELAELGNCFLQLKLVLNKGGKKENVLMEMTLPQFYRFLAQMEAAKFQCDNLS